MFDNIFFKRVGADGTCYADLIIKGEFGIAVGFGATNPGQSIIVAVVSYEDRSFISTDVSGVHMGANYNDNRYIDRSKS